MIHYRPKAAWSVVLLVPWMCFPGCDSMPTGGNEQVADETSGNPDDLGEVPDETGRTLALFSDPDSDFSTTDVRDIHEEIVRFDTAGKTLIWAADGSAFGGWEVSGNFLGSLQQFQVRFGTKDGERRAYFTETVPATICDIFVENGRLRIVSTNVTVPTG